MADTIRFELSYSGQRADANEIDFYDISEALLGFQRSLALTTHLVLNGEIITQAPALKGAQILASPPEAGSWKVGATILVIGTGIYHFATAPKDTPLGNLVSSAYDYMISETLGFHVDYSKTLGQQYEELKSSNAISAPLPQSKFDALIEKCEGAIQTMHRPIVKSGTASQAIITVGPIARSRVVGQPMDRHTYEYVAYTEHEDTPQKLRGRVSSYNINTYKGRAYLFDERRPIPFILAESARSKRNVSLITNSLQRNAAGVARFRSRRRSCAEQTG
jgi:hypothetical protein